MAKISKDYIDNFGKVPTSPWLSGEQGHHTSTVVQGGARREEIQGPKDRTWSEPDTISPSRSMNTVVFQAKNGGNSVVVNDEGSDGDGYMLITHNTGTIVQIDQHGTVFIKSFGDTYNTTEGIHYQRSEGDTNTNVGGDWNVRVEQGGNHVYVAGDVNIECENYNLEVRGKATINAAEALELRGAKVSVEASVTDIDMAAAMNIRTTSVGGYTSIGSTGDIILSTKALLHQYADTEIRIGSAGPYIVNVDGKIDMLAGGNAWFDGSKVYLGENDGVADPAQPVNAQPPELKVPEARRPSVDSNDNVNMVNPTPGSISDRLGDDTE
jgi:hypothetical protein